MHFMLYFVDCLSVVYLPDVIFDKDGVFFAFWHAFGLHYNFQRCLSGTRFCKQYWSLC